MFLLWAVFGMAEVVPFQNYGWISEQGYETSQALCRAL
jgi:hypothetical protein